MNRKPEYRNSRFILNMLAAGLILALAILPGFAKPVAAADPTIVFPAGQACDFDLGLDFYGEGSQVYKEFMDKSGTVVRTLLAGTGYDLVFTNVDTGATFSTKANGAVQQTKYNPDGSFTRTLLGHNIVILFPTDVPAGPSTTLYVGRVVITSDKDFNFTSLQSNAQKTDICAALSR